MFQLLFILIIIQYINNEFQGRNIYLISRLKSKQNWFLNLELTLILASIIYFFIGFLTLIACSKLLATSLQFSNKEIYAFIIIFLNSLFYVNFYLFTIILLKHNKYSLLGLILLIFINIDLGSVLKIDLYNPFTQCIFLKYYLINNSFLNSIMILLISNSLIVLSLYFAIIKKDLLNITI
ncbi:Putative membrane protein [Clostridium chauvoei JF4335]|nr:Putative membrane protein [Clostridium chauvoei JF4335]